MLSSQTIAAQLQRLVKWQPGKHMPVLVAVSGGADSMVLLHVLHSLQLPLHVVHCNYQLRGEESQRDAALVEQYCTAHAIPHTIQLCTIPSQANIQVQAREMRYALFQELATEKGCQWIATAHTATDSVETSLHHFFRGTGLHGVAGIPIKNGKIIRPLLGFTRTQIEAYAQQYQVPFVNDSSNATNKYTRNFFRNEVMPLVQERMPNAATNAVQTMQHLQAAQHFYKAAISQKLSKLVQKLDNGSQLAIPALLKQPFYTTVLWEWAQQHRFDASQLPEIEKLLTANNGATQANDHWQIIKNRNFLIASPVAAFPEHIHVPLPIPGEVLLPNGKLIATLCNQLPHDWKAQAPHTVYVPAALLKNGIVRRWQEGDYFYPLGLGKKKKLSRFFIDEKLNILEKKEVWLLTQGNHIVWVVGRRLDDRYKISDQSTQFIKLVWQSYF